MQLTLLRSSVSPLAVLTFDLDNRDQVQVQGPSPSLRPNGCSNQARLCRAKVVSDSIWKTRGKDAQRGAQGDKRAGF